MLAYLSQLHLYLVWKRSGEGGQGPLRALMFLDPESEDQSPMDMIESQHQGRNFQASGVAHYETLSHPSKQPVLRVCLVFFLVAVIKIP